MAGCSSAADFTWNAASRGCSDVSTKHTFSISVTSSQRKKKKKKELDLLWSINITWTSYHMVLALIQFLLIQFSESCFQQPNSSVLLENFAFSC